MAVELCTCWLGKGMSFLAEFLERRLVQSRSTVMIPLHKRVVFIRLLHRTQLPSRNPEVAQTLDAITGIQFRARG
jgi:hypothetical protein